MPDPSQLQPVAFNCQGGLVLNRSSFLMDPGQAIELENFEPDIQGGYRRINGYTKHVNQVVPITNTTAEEPLMVASFNNKVLAARGERIYVSTSTQLAIRIESSTGMTGSGSITVDSTTGFATSGTLQIDDEKFTYTGVTSNSFTGVTRATSSTTAAAHTTDSSVSIEWTQIDTDRTNALKYQFERFNFDNNEKIIFVDQVNAPVVFNTSLSATDVSDSSVEGATTVAAYRNHMFYAGNF